MRRVALGLVLVWLIALVALTERRLPEWKDDVTIWQAAVRADPESATSHDTLGEALVDQRRWNEAESHYWFEVARRPDRMVSHVMLALAFAQRGASGEQARQMRIVERMAADRFGPGKDPVLTTRGDRIMGLIVKPEPGFERALFGDGAPPGAH